MTLLKNLLAASTALAKIRPPERSFVSWQRFLDECHEAGITDLVAETKQFYHPLGFALLVRWRWLRTSIAAGLSYDQAEGAFAAGVDRAREAERASAHRFEKQRSEGIQAVEEERRAKRRTTRRAADGYAPDDVFTYASERGL